VALFVPRWERFLQEALHKLPPEKLLEAHTETTRTVARLMHTLLGFSFFCILALGSPDRYLLEGVPTLNMPFGGRISFSTFIWVGPAVLVGLRFYLQVYLAHRECLERVLRSSSAVKTPTVSPLEHPLLWPYSFLAWISTEA
jgi:hypothetical protein